MNQTHSKPRRKEPSIAASIFWCAVIVLGGGLAIGWLLLELTSEIGKLFRNLF